MTFVSDIARSHGISDKHLLVKYLQRKTRAVDRGSKARRSLGNLYALLVLSQDYLEDRTSRFTDLLSRMKSLPFGAKLQNHPLDNRLNDEFSRQMDVTGVMLPVRASTLNGQKARSISVELLGSSNADPKVAAAFVVDTIMTYVTLITENQSTMLGEIEAVQNLTELTELLDRALLPKSDARLFEIVSYVLLSQFYSTQTVWIGNSQEDVKPARLQLFRSGRTNANDGGIDFILKPSGRLFQVTETMEFSKYFLDLEKINRYPMTFVIKVESSASDALAQITNDATRAGKYTQEQVRLYTSLFEEIFTLPDLRRIMAGITARSIDEIKSELSLQFQLEYGLLD